MQLSGGTLTVGAAVAAVGATVIKATKEWSEYGAKWSEVFALTGATGKSLQYLDDQAQAIEKDTGIAGVTILKAFKNIAGIKPELLENNEALAQTTKEVIALSQADPRNITQTRVKQFGFGLPPIIVQQMQQPNFAQPIPVMDTSRLEAELHEQKDLTRTLIQHTLPPCRRARSLVSPMVV